jgi:hypothetical protein
MRMLAPFQVGQKKPLFKKFDWGLIPMWPFSETNAAAMRAPPARPSLVELLRTYRAVCRAGQGPERSRRFGFESIMGFLKVSWRCP